MYLPQLQQQMIQLYRSVMLKNMTLSMLMDGHGMFPVKLHQKGRGEVLSVGLVYSRSPHQALYVLVNLHLESPIKSSCYVATHQALSVTLYLQNSIKKLSFVAPSTPLFVTLLIILDLLSLYQYLLLKQTEPSMFKNDP